MVTGTEIEMATVSRDPVYTEPNPDPYEMETFEETSGDHTYKRLNLSDGDSDNDDAESTPLKTVYNPYETQSAVNVTELHIYKSLMRQNTDPLQNGIVLESETNADVEEEGIALDDETPRENVDLVTQIDSVVKNTVPGSTEDEMSETTNVGSHIYPLEREAGLKPHTTNLDLSNEPVIENNEAIENKLWSRKNDLKNYRKHNMWSKGEILR